MCQMVNNGLCQWDSWTSALPFLFCSWFVEYQMLRWNKFANMHAIEDLCHTMVFNVKRIYRFYRVLLRRHLFHAICCQLFPWTVIWLKRLTILIQLLFIFKFTYIVIWHDSVYSFLKCYYVNLNETLRGTYIILYCL